jgi:hypothetical protein
VDNYRWTKRSSNRAAVKAYIKAQALGVSLQHVVQRGGPFKMHLENSRFNRNTNAPSRSDTRNPDG